MKRIHRNLVYILLLGCLPSIGLAQATKLVVTSVNGGSNPTAGTGFTVIVFANDDFNTPANVVSSTTVQLALRVGFGTGTLGGTLSGIIPAGFDSVVITGVTYTKAESGVEIRATATSGDALSSDNSSPFTVDPGPASQLVVSVQPQTPVTAGVAFTPQPKVQVQDTLGNVVTSDNSTAVTASINTGNSTLLGTTTMTAVAGVVTFSNLSYQMAESITLKFQSGGLTSAISNTVVVNPASASTTTSTITANRPSIIANGIDTTGIKVQLKDTYGNNLTGSGGPVVVLTNFGTMSSTTNNGDGTYKATLTSSATTGTATVTATVNSATITDNASVAFTSGGINKFSVTMSGGTTLLSAAAKTAGTPFQVRVTAQDVNGNTVTGYTGSVSLTSNAFGATIPASISTGGFVDLVSVTPTIAGSGDRTISASDGITVTSNASGNFTVNPGAASSLVFVQSPGNSVAGALLSPQPVVEVRDQYANPVTGLSGNVTIAIGNNAGGATLSGTATRPLNTSTARATFTNLILDKTGTAYTLTASSAVAPSSGTSASFNITPAAAYALVFVQSPSNSIASSLLTPQPIVELQDQFGNAVTGQSGNVTVAIGTNPGGGSLTGTKLLPLNTATAQAVYTNLSINKVGVGYTLISSGGVAPHGDTSAAFTITTASASTIALVSGDGQSAPINRSLGSALVVKVTDAGANPVSGVTVVFSVDSIPAGATGQSVSPLSAVTDVNGLASTSLHLGNKVGRYA
ncbi:MAG: Ig-like domain-containing protein, partial [Bacteroidota bacterium]